MIVLDGPSVSLLSHWLLLFIPSKVSKMPAFLRSAIQILFSEDSAKLFVASNQGSLHIIQLLEGGFKHLHTFQPPSGRPGSWSQESCQWWRCNCALGSHSAHPASMLTCWQFTVGGMTLDEVWNVPHTHSFLTGILIPYLGPGKFRHLPRALLEQSIRKVKII